MPIQTQWYNEQKTIIVFKFANPWTIEEFLKADASVGAELMEFDHTVDAIFDLSDASLLPKNLLSSFLRAARQTENAPNQGVTIVISNNMLIDVTANAVIQLTRQQERIFVVRDEATAIRTAEQKQAERVAGMQLAS